MIITHNIARAAAFGLIFQAVGNAEASQKVAFMIPDYMSLTFEDISTYEQNHIPIAVLNDGQVPSKAVIGPLRRRSWISTEDSTTIDQFAEVLLSQLDAFTYETLLDCRDAVCGGFDFRFKIDVVPAPHVYVNLGNFRYISLKFGAQYQTILISKLANTLWLQITETSESKNFSSTELIVKRLSSGAPHQSGTVPENLIAHGHAILSDLEYDSGSSNLGEGPFTSVRELADYLLKHPAASVVLVGHTDIVGKLETNINLSKDRAQAVADRLIRKYGVNSDQLSSDGVGYLSPITSNDTDQGREMNRRVEVVLEKIPK